jgi:hypothetical protein
VNSEQNPNIVKENSVERAIEHIGAEVMPTFYANSVEIIVSPFDFGMIFGLVENATAEELRIRQLARILMSPTHLKLFASIINERLAEYERQYGQVADVRKQSITPDSAK